MPQDEVDNGVRDWHYFFFGLLLPASLNAMATACFCGFPAFISVLMLLEMVLLLEPFFNGIASSYELALSKISPQSMHWRAVAFVIFLQSLLL
jgi:hypothetical protein